MNAIAIMLKLWLAVRLCRTVAAKSQAPRHELSPPALGLDFLPIGIFDCAVLCCQKFMQAFQLKLPPHFECGRQTHAFFAPKEIANELILRCCFIDCGDLLVQPVDDDGVGRVSCCIVSGSPCRSGSRGCFQFFAYVSRQRIAVNLQDGTNINRAAIIAFAPYKGGTDAVDVL